MDDRSWMYQDSPKGLYRKNYLEEFEGFIIFVPFKLKNISIGKIRCSCVKCKNKKSHHKDIVMIHLIKKVLSRNAYVYLHMKNLMLLTKPC
jgi:hypothetical protein